MSESILFDTPKSIAEMALKLLSLPKSDDPTAAAIEMAAAMTATHVFDWHKKAGLLPDNKTAFGALHPDWNTLRLISNGLKHPQAHYPDVGSSYQRPVEWEDLDFWYADHDRPILFVNVEGQERGVGALVRSFCKNYIEATSSHAPPSP